MARKSADDAQPTDGTNTIDPARLKKIIEDIEQKVDAKLSHKMEYVESCKAYNEAISNAYEMGSKFVPKKILKAKIKERELQRKIDGIAEEFEEDDLDLFDQVTQALGGYASTPLGMAATRAAAKGERRPLAKKEGGKPSGEAGADSEAFKAGYAARQAAKNDAIPDELKGDDRDRYYNGWLAAERDITSGKESADKLSSGIKGMPGADAPGKHTVQ